jgi:hypothetical protein
LAWTGLGSRSTFSHHWGARGQLIFPDEIYRLSDVYLLVAYFFVKYQLLASLASFQEILLVFLLRRHVLRRSFAAESDLSVSQTDVILILGISLLEDL